MSLDTNDDNVKVEERERDRERERERYGERRMTHHTLLSCVTSDVQDITAFTLLLGLIQDLLSPGTYEGCMHLVHTQIRLCMSWTVTINTTFENNKYTAEVQVE